MKEPSDERHFIPILAAFDLIATIYCGIYMIIQCFNQVTFTHNILCKTTQFFIGLTTFIPILLLLIIAVQRYLKVCRPLRPAISLNVKRTALILTAVISLLCALPLPYIYGSVSFHSITYGSTGTRCGKVKEGRRLARAVYAIVIGVLAVALVTTLIFLYSLIGCTVFRQLKMNKCKSSRVEFRNSGTKTDENGVSVTENSDVTQNTITSDIDSKISNLNIVKIDINCKEQRLENKKQTTLSQPVGSKRRRKDNRRITHKLTVMFFVITLVFIISYLPKVMLLLFEGLYKDFWEKVSDTERPGLMFLYQMFIINNIVNPFIYAFMDIKFRKEATVFLRRVFQCTF
ncbi:CCKAR [Mytilus coruscus]|uniref:CCKAR n=1 Tax=Mytilus coruscus TaxID=42192 RepID=A0A6J8BNX8_MYTCO|nr:CCKAR [Mytilus coruscus]